jgi:hypothetical protein
VRALPDEQSDPDQSRGDRGQPAERDADAEDRAIEDRREQRHGRDEECRQSRGDPLLGT